MDEFTIHSERRYLQVSAGGNLFSATLGLVFAVLTASQAILLDGLFDITYFVAALFTLKVARLVHRDDDDHFPYGYIFFEPLINGLKGLLVFGVCLLALVDASRALLAGGREIAAGIAMLYGGIAALLCAGIALFLRRRNVRLQSPLIRADVENWFVNASISGCVVLAFGSIFVLKQTPLVWLTPYVDPLFVIAVVLFSISLPVRMAWQALMELLNRTPSPQVRTEAQLAVEEALAGWPAEEVFVRVIQPGRARLVLAHVVLPKDHPVSAVKEFDDMRTQTLRRLRGLHSMTVLDMVFTGNRLWGAPTGLTQPDSLIADTLANEREEGKGQT